ncbi:MAG: hypothetical protein ACT4PV_00235 [Planctomycetaceae bacterium]
MPLHTGTTWPWNDNCAETGYPPGSAHSYLKSIVERALAVAPANATDSRNKWRTVFWAARCALNHATPPNPTVPEAKTACGHLMAAFDAAGDGAWTLCQSELNHGGDQPKPTTTASHPKKRKK